GERDGESKYAVESGAHVVRPCEGGASSTAPLGRAIRRSWVPPCDWWSRSSPRSRTGSRSGRAGNAFACDARVARRLLCDCDRSSHEQTQPPKEMTMRTQRWMA